MQPKVILITGASSGMGYQTARILAEQGHRVYGAARRVEKIEELAKTLLKNPVEIKLAVYYGFDREALFNIPVLIKFENSYNTL